jgi:hypothetical protein
VNGLSSGLCIVESFQDAPWRGHDTGPDGLNAGDNHGTDQNDRHGAFVGIKDADHALVPGKQAWGDEMGRFKLGSTAIVLFGKDQMSWLNDLSAGDSVLMGQTIGHFS